MKKFYLSLPLVLLLAMAGCSNSKNENPASGEPIAGGACEYSYDSSMAILIQIDTSVQYDLIFLVNRKMSGNGLDTVSYYEENLEHTSVEEVQNANLKIGDTIQWIEGFITQGTCNPDASQFILKKYSKKE